MRTATREPQTLGGEGTLDRMVRILATRNIDSTPLSEPFLYSIATGLPFSSSPRVSIRPRCHGPVGYSDARNRIEHRLQASVDLPLQLYREGHRRTGQLDVPPVGVSPAQHQLGHQRPLLRSLEEEQSTPACAYSGLGQGRDSGVGWSS